MQTDTVRHPSEDDLVLYHYRESERISEIEEHLDLCESCRSSYRALTGVLAAVESARVPEPDDTFEARTWHRLEPRLVEAARPRWAALFQPARLALAGAVATLIVGAFLAGRHFPPAPSPTAPAPSTAEAVGHEPVRDRILLIAVGDHLERSQMALVELVNAQAQDEMDISGEQQRARDLVSANRLYRQSAAREGETVVASVLDDLERVLLEVAHSPSKLSSGEFDEIRRRIESQGIIFKVRVVESNVRERQRQPAADTASARTRS